MCVCVYLRVGGGINSSEMADAKEEDVSLGEVELSKLGVSVKDQRRRRTDVWVVEGMGSSDERRTTKPWSTVALNRSAVDSNVLLLLLTPDPFGPTPSVPVASFC